MKKTVAARTSFGPAHFESKGVNSKIKNASVTIEGNIKFKSKLEKTIYNCLVEAGLRPEYEPTRFVVVDSFTAKTPFYDKETDAQIKKRRELGDCSPRKLTRKSSSIQCVRYTPDFYFRYKNLDVYIEAKGFENDVFYLKKKLFIKYLDSREENSIYFEVYTKKQLLQAIEIVKAYEPATTNNT